MTARQSVIGQRFGSFVAFCATFSSTVSATPSTCSPESQRALWRARAMLAELEGK